MSMSIWEIVLLMLALYQGVYVILWVLLDCNVKLWWKHRFGTPISSMRGQVVWITGASSGIGRALAINLARHGVRLALSARRLEQLEAVREECLVEARGLLASKDVLVLQMNMLEYEKHQECFQSVLQHFGHMDVLVNNAGRSQRADWTEIDVRVDRELFELDVFAVVNLSRLAVRYFLEQAGGRGHIACTSSIAGLLAAPFSASYCAAKAAINSYMITLKLEHPQLDVTVFAPGPVATDFLQEAFTGVPDRKFDGSTKNQRRMTAERCGELFATAIANKLSITWCALFPVNVLTYIAREPRLAQILPKVLGRKTLNLIREGKK